MAGYQASLQKGHQSIKQINKMMDSLIVQIQSANSAELKAILNNVEEIARRYRLLESETVSLVQKSKSVSSDVRMAAEGALNDELTFAEALESMNQDFDRLSKSMQKTIESHSDITKELRDQADNAKEAKERNDQLGANVRELKDQAKNFGILAVPGVSIVNGPVVGAMMAADAVDNKALKVIAGVGGAVGGLLGGVVMTALTPVFAGWAIRCAVLAGKWSGTFNDLSGQILEVEQAISGSSRYLSSISAMITELAEKISKCDSSKTKALLKLQFKKIIQSSEELHISCVQYLGSLHLTRNNEALFSTRSQNNSEDSIF